MRSRARDRGISPLVADRETGGDTHAMLRRVVTSFSMITLLPITRGTAQVFHAHFHQMPSFLQFHIFPRWLPSPLPGNRNIIFLSPDSQASLEGAYYYSGAVMCATTWMKHCRAIFKVKEPSFSGLWVGNTVPKEVSIQVDVRETLAGVLRRCEVDFAGDDSIRGSKQKSQCGFRLAGRSTPNTSPTS
ncbi:hypothetical protein EDD18DRAFT_160512 [Armillaria luteobubalina]|uniref:Uncharacterized protein n=1 Tax=Armillaria luteobubalina TaxID=153913 RepID=A0AA39Q9G5_9AGAR|nr:hypothetical protein EDD18DRAFT_160512 [Armillaria luteobubalina]